MFILTPRDDRFEGNQLNKCENKRVATLFRRTRNFVFTKYIRDCCDTLLAAGEHDTDQFLVSLIRMQRLLARVSDAIPNPDQDEHVAQTMDASVHMMMETTKRELDKLIQAQPPRLQTNGMF